MLLFFSEDKGFGRAKTRLLGTLLGLFFSFSGQSFSAVDKGEQWRLHWEHFLAEHPQLERLERSRKSADLQSLAALDRYDWIAKAGAQYSDSFLDDLFGFFVQPTKETLFTIGLEKATTFGGVLEYSSEVTDFDLSGWRGAQAQGLPGTDPFEVRHSFSFTQDLWQNAFGRRNRTEIKTAQAQARTESVQLAIAERDLIQQFFRAYIQLVLEQRERNLRQNFLIQARRRLGVARKRFQDGVARKVELYQAQLSVAAQEELVALAQERYDQKKREYYLNFGAKNALADLDRDTLQALSFTELEQQKDDNLELELTRSRLATARLRLQDAKNLLAPQLKLRLAITTNSIDATFDESAQNAWPGNQFEQKVAALSLSIPLGRRQAKRKQAMVSLELQNEESQLSQLHRELAALKKGVKKSKGFLDRALEKNRRKIEISRLVLEEQKRLYRRGELQIDTLIDQEEQLLQALVAQRDLFFAYLQLWSTSLELSGTVSNLGEMFKKALSGQES